MNTQLPSPPQAKDQARRLRAKMANEGTRIGHAKSLERIAHLHGFQDWNTMSAAIGNDPNRTWTPSDQITGTYLSQPFTARIVAVAPLKLGWVRLELHLDETIDVVTSEGFSNLRKRLRGTVGPKGHSVERTSDGQSHLQIDLWPPQKPCSFTPHTWDQLSATKLGRVSLTFAINGHLPPSLAVIAPLRWGKS